MTTNLCVRIGRLGFALLIAAAAAGCGSRLEHEQLLAEARRASDATTRPDDPLAIPAGSEETETQSDATSATSNETAAPALGTEPAGTKATGPSSRSAATTSGAGARVAVPKREARPSSPVGPGPRAVGGSKAANPPQPQSQPPNGGICSEKKSTISIGSVGQQSGVAGASVNGTAAVQAWVKSTNVKGGLNCHPLRFIVADDGGDPSRHQSEVQRLVEREGVLAFVYNDGAITWQASEKYISERRIPVIGTEGGEHAVYSNPMYFPQMSSVEVGVEAIFAGASEVLKPQGLTTLGMTACVEVPYCSTLYDLAAEYGPKYGFNVVYRGKVSLVQPDYTSHCQRAKDAKAQVFLIGTDANAATRTIRSCERINYRPQYVMHPLTAGPTIVPEKDGAVVSQLVKPWFGADSPAVSEYREVLKKFAPGVEPSALTMQAWVAAKLFELGAKALAEPPTSQSILEGLWGITNNDLGGLTQPLSFRKDQPAVRRLCFWTTQIKGNQYVSLGDPSRHCV